MNEEGVLKIFKKVGAIVTGSHVVYASGRHGSTYVNKDVIYPHTQETSCLCRAIAERFANDNVEVVIAPAIGGVILSQWTAHHLSRINRHEVFCVYAEKSDSGDVFVIKRGYDKFVTNRRVLVIEDILTTGGSAKKVIVATRAIGGNVIGLGVLCNRGGITLKDVANIPKLVSLINLKLDTWDETDCPLCKDDLPINIDIGKGREFLERKRKHL